MPGIRYDGRRWRIVGGRVTTTCLRAPQPAETAHAPAEPRFGQVLAGGRTTDPGSLTWIRGLSVVSASKSKLKTDLPMTSSVSWEKQASMSTASPEAAYACTETEAGW